MTHPTKEQKLSERLKTLMWELGPDRYILMRELILEAERLERACRIGLATPTETETGGRYG